MKINITELTLEQIKTSANRLRNYLPEKKRYQLLDICTHQLTGLASYSEAQREVKNILEGLPTVPEGWPDISTYGEYHGIVPTIRRGHWYYYPKHTSLVFEGFTRSYPIGLIDLSDTSKLLDMILHLHRKRTPKKFLKGRLRCETFQVDEFLLLIQDLSEKERCALVCYL